MRGPLSIWSASTSFGVAEVVDQTDDVRADRSYVAGRGRDWIKVKRQRSVDCVVVGLADDLQTPITLIEQASKLAATGNEWLAHPRDTCKP